MYNVSVSQLSTVVGVKRPVIGKLPFAIPFIVVAEEEILRGEHRSIGKIIGELGIVLNCTHLLFNCTAINMSMIDRHSSIHYPSLSHRIRESPPIAASLRERGSFTLDESFPRGRRPSPSFADISLADTHSPVYKFVNLLSARRVYRFRCVPVLSRVYRTLYPQTFVFGGVRIARS